MPWGPRDAKRHNRKLKSPKQRRQWSHIANDVLRKTGSESRAIRTANGVIKKQARKTNKRKSGRAASRS